MKRKDLKYLQYRLGDKTLYIVKDHSVVIKCWKRAVEEKHIVAHSLLIHLDRHADFCFDNKNKEKSLQLAKLDDLEFDNFIRDDLHSDNAEFIANAMFGGVIKDCISIDWENGCPFGVFFEGNKATTDRYNFAENDIIHNFFFCETQDLIFGYNSLLGDSYIHQDTRLLFENSKSIILDIDLDYFTYSHHQTYAKNKKDIERQLYSKAFQNLLAKANIITVALEPECCGSNEDCYEICTVFSDFLLNRFDVNVLDDVNNTWLRCSSV